MSEFEVSTRLWSANGSVVDLRLSDPLHASVVFLVAYWCRYINLRLSMEAVVSCERGVCRHRWENELSKTCLCSLPGNFVANEASTCLKT